MHLTRCQIGYSPPIVSSQKQYVGSHPKHSPHNQSQSANRQSGSTILRDLRRDWGEARKPLAIFSRPVGAAGTIAKTISAYDMTSQKARATSACRIAIITQAKIS